MGLDQGFRDEQAEAGTTPVRAPGLPEAVEYVREGLPCDARSGIGHPEAHLVAPPLRSNPDATAGRSEFDRVADEV